MRTWTSSPQQQRNGPGQLQCGAGTGPTHILGRLTAPPSEPPESGPAREQPPAGEQWRPTTTVYSYPHPLLWVYLPHGWTLATVTAKQVYSNGLTVFQVELAMPNPDGTTSRVSRAFLWGPDNIRPA